MNLYLIDGARLRRLREERGLSREDLSRATGPYNPDGVRLIEELERQPRVHVLETIGRRIAAALGVGLSELTAYPDPPEDVLLAEKPTGATLFSPDSLLRPPRN
ncbi:MAG: helix-turn-helix domain-containing protein [Rubrobacteraceae bacterium]|nr:helix-turn-helix domain-containing protein [Rubrobacteraceae bacterium]MCL6439075.1 helix-turn-helix domain-containing protein [Rubrobacteraceae bacterium]